MKNGTFTNYVAYGIAAVTFIGGIVYANGGEYDDFSLVRLLIVWITGIIAFALFAALGAIQSNQDDLIETIKQLQLKSSTPQEKEPSKALSSDEAITVADAKTNESSKEATSDSDKSSPYKGIYY